MNDHATQNGELSRPGRRRLARWPVFLIVALVVQGAGVLWMVTIAGRDPSFAIEPHYYEKAVAWDQTARQEAVNRSLGWTASASITGADPQGRRTLRIELRDSLGRPLEGASVAAEVFHQARAGERVRVECGAVQPGIYAGTAAIPRPGAYELRLTVSRGPEVFTRVITADAAGQGTTP